jgi:hypothetical protein
LCCANNPGTSPAASLPRPTSTIVPTIFLTIWRRNDFPRTTYTHSSAKS